MFVAPVLLRASLADSDNAALSVQADLLAQDIAEKILAQLGAAPGEIPDLDSTISAAAVPARLIVTFRPDGSASRRALSMSGDTMATVILTRAFDALRDAGGAAILWPDGFKANSIDVRLELASAAVGPDGHIMLIAKKHPAFRVFRLLEPYVGPALVRPNQPIPHYPREAEHAGVEVSVLLQFIVDTNGRAVPESISDLREQAQRQLTPDAFKYYDSFARATREAVGRWHFIPAHIDACAVKQWVQLPIKFEAPFTVRINVRSRM